MIDEKPTRCINPVVKLCQDCKYGYVKYPEWVETYKDTLDCSFESGCTLGLEDTEPTKEELLEYEQWIRSELR